MFAIILGHLTAQPNCNKALNVSLLAISHVDMLDILTDQKIFDLPGVKS